ncbi:MAG: 4Fe-4S dicluster domain-containing protein [Deltaproteobacteria bacterium]|nr:4Fe-4S dicluster domain-containing protein [Deltaproteobacteria bacterium]
MVYDVLLWLSVAVCILGILYRVYGWFSRCLEGETGGASVWRRTGAALSGTWRCLSRGRGFRDLGLATVLDVFLLERTRKRSLQRWIMHGAIFWGVLYLVLFHALDGMVTEELFSDYQSSLNPWFFLRDAAGALVLSGVAVAVVRRIRKHVLSSARDWIALALVGGIVCSGFGLQAMKMTSMDEFDRMVSDYSSVDPDDVPALESFWAAECGLVSHRVGRPFDPEVLDKGREVNEEACAFCHAPSRWAPVSFALARGFSPLALEWNHFRAVDMLWWVHVLLTLFGLASLPFTKMFHILATPLSLIVRRVSGLGTATAENFMTRRVLELDACTHCGECSANCSAMAASWTLDNDLVLPGEKVQALRRTLLGLGLTRQEREALRQGVSVCSSCGRCTALCPSGIDLKSIWLEARNVLVREHGPEPFALSPFFFARSVMNACRDFEVDSKAAFNLIRGGFRNPAGPIPLVDQENKLAAQLSRNKTFSYCFSCQTCTTLCPVVMSYENPEKELGLLPHQIMCCLGLGLTEMALGSKMIWKCLTCYKCQEYCPQQVRIVDLFYRLKHTAVAEIGLSRREV